MHKNNILDWSGPKVNVYKGQKKKVRIKIKGGKKPIEGSIRNQELTFSL